MTDIDVWTFIIPPAALVTIAVVVSVGLHFVQWLFPLSMIGGAF